MAIFSAIRGFDSKFVSGLFLVWLLRIKYPFRMQHTRPMSGIWFKRDGVCYIAVSRTTYTYSISTNSLTHPLSPTTYVEYMLRSSYYTAMTLLVFLRVFCVCALLLWIQSQKEHVWRSHNWITLLKSTDTTAKRLRIEYDIPPPQTTQVASSSSINILWNLLGECNKNDLPFDTRKLWTFFTRLEPEHESLTLSLLLVSYSDL